MPLSGDTVLVLNEIPPRLPMRDLLVAWWRAQFDPSLCKQALERWMTTFAVPDHWFRPSEVEAGGIAATDDILFDAFLSDRDWWWGLRASAGRVSFVTRVTRDAIATIAQLIRDIATSASAEELLAEWGTLIDANIRVAVQAAFRDPKSYGSWPDFSEPGIYRREHASIAVSSGTTVIIIDPQGFAGGWATNDARYPGDSRVSADAVLITHSHQDHWHLPSVLRHCTNDTRVIVPRVPRVNLLTPDDFVTALSLACQPCEPLDWQATVRVGDMEIEALPFYGEQPTRDGAAAPAGVRSWGNCYRIACPRFTLLVLADSGIDPMGNIADVVAETVARAGNVDVVVSGCRSFPEGINLGLPSYFLTVPFVRLREIFDEHRRGQWQSTTSGTMGVAEICAISNARFFLPYAHGFEGIGVNVDNEQRVPGGASYDYADELERLLESKTARTKVVRWNPGDCFTMPE